MWITSKEGVSDDIIEDFLKNVWQVDYLDEQQPGVIETMEWIENLRQDTLREYIFIMLFQHKLKKILDSTIKTSEETNLVDIIYIIIELIERFKKEKYIDKYSISYQYKDSSEIITINYFKNVHEYSIAIQL